jgi:hypothetical protein
MGLRRVARGGCSEGPGMARPGQHAGVGGKAQETIGEKLVGKAHARSLARAGEKGTAAAPRPLRPREVAMNAAHERTRSPWMEVEVFPAARKLTRDIDTDVLVIGSGIAGLSVAYELLARGRSVTVVDSGAIGTGMTARTTAHLSAISDDWYAEFIRRRGEDMARLFHDSHASAIARIGQIVAAHAIDCNFRRLDGLLFPGDAQGERKIEEELDAAQRLRIEAHRVQGGPFAGLSAATALCYPGQDTFQPAR